MKPWSDLPSVDATFLSTSFLLTSLRSTRRPTWKPRLPSLATCLVVALTWFGATSGPAYGSETLVRLDFERDRATSDVVFPPRPAVLTADCGDCGDELTFPVEVPGSYRLEIPSDKHWLVSLELEGFWTAPQTLEGDSSLDFELRRTGPVSGLADLPEGSTPPSTVSVWFQTAPQAPAALPGSAPPGPEATRFRIDCPMEEDGAWECELPHGRLDLKLELAGLAPVYLWDVRIDPADRLQLGRLAFSEGASLAGWVEITSDPAVGSAVPFEPPRLEIVPALAGPLQAADQSRVLRRRESVEATERGFFQFVGLAPGTYDLVARRAGLAETRFEKLVIEAPEELLLDTPVVLQPPVRAQFFLDPPLDPTGQPWEVQVRTISPTGVFETVAESFAEMDGSLAVGGLASREYELVVFDQQTSQWAQQTFEAAHGARPVFVEIPVVPIEGTIRFGDTPLETLLNFGGQTTPNIYLRSDAEGRFEGYLPREGLWHVDLVDIRRGLEQRLGPVDVHLREGQTTAELDLVLPSTFLHGTVTKDSQPAKGALLTLVRDGAKIERGGLSKTDGEGAFEFAGIPPGQYSIQARGSDSSSEWIRVEVDDGFDTPELRLELRPKTEIKGTISSSHGAVPGALVVAVPVAGLGGPRFLARDTSRADGTFTLELDSSTPAVDLIVAAPPFALRVARVSVTRRGNPPVHLSVDQLGGALAVRWSDAFATPSLTVDHLGTQIPIQTLLQLHPAGLVSSAGEYFVFSPVAAGDYSLCSRSPGRPATCVDGTLPPHGDLALELLPTVAANH